MRNVRPRPNGTYQAYVRVKGHKDRYKTFSTGKEARKWVLKMETDLQESTATDPNVRIDKLIERYRDEVAPKRKTMAPSHLSHDIPSIIRVFKGMKMADLQGRGLINWVNTRPNLPKTCHWHIARLRGVLRQAEHHWDVVVPWNDIALSQRKMLAVGSIAPSGERDRRCADVELDLIKTKINPDANRNWVDLFDFCVATAMRIGEVCRIEWKDFDEENRTILIRDRKHPTKKMGNHKVVPLLNGSFEILARQPRKKPRIFATAPTYASKVFHQCVIDAQIEDLVLHDLRHEGISRLFEKGFSIEEVSLVSGHTDWSTLKRYTHLKPTSLVAKERKLDRALAAA